MDAASVIVISSFISPYQADRVRTREIIGSGRFIEVFVSTPLRACEDRDLKGLYVKARSGLLPNFTGISAPYESPLAPALVLDMNQLSVPDCVAKLLSSMRIEN